MPGALRFVVLLVFALGCSDRDRDKGCAARDENDNQAKNSFFFFGDAHFGPSANNAKIDVAMRQMSAIAPDAIAAFSNGDLVDSDSEQQWAMHDAGIAAGGFAANDSCAHARYFGALGDHDVSDGHWLELWNRHFGAQTVLGPDTPNGIYYAVAYGEALFVMLDSEHVSAEKTSYADEQTRWLESVLAASSARLKFIFFHEPVYPCSGHHAPFAAGLPWVDLAERYGVNAFIGSHTHIYTRSCPRLGGACALDGAGIVFIESGPLGGVPRDLDVETATATGTDASGNARSDDYDCALGQSLLAARGSSNDFCHLQIDGCKASVHCYAVAAENTTPFDSFSFDGCE